MQKLRNAMITSAVLSIGILGTGTLFAQEQAQEKGQQHDSMMDEGGMNDNMMKKCSAMMGKDAGNMMDDGEMNDNMRKKCNDMMGKDGMHDNMMDEGGKSGNMMDEGGKQ
jgi:hypothetical protein